MANNPTNEECADMFRVLMAEMLEMHPQYRVLRRLTKELCDAVERKAPRKEVLVRLRTLKETFRSFDE